MTTLFISDLHLDPSRPDIASQFLEFLEGEASSAEALYILGDLFEVWVGDDDPEPEKRRAVAGLKRLSDRGVPCFLMHGNRDFLLGSRFAGETGCRILDDPTIVHLYGSRVLATHGDMLCTDDISYQRLRTTVRDLGWQSMFLALAVEQRLALATEARAGSKDHVSRMSAEIMDVNPAAVQSAMRAAGVTLLLHGHTHRPKVHELSVDGKPSKRIVLGDWYDQGSVLRWNDRGFDLVTLERN
ncbi:MAG TPA: UDP-2,3-diacylglucosamine diphosphatase [Steroidobacteraceae bacterium]|nr:UDP-2,3-diacylglucosamine diphosphatase [Steroidobacteraceae bacterium]